MNRQTPMRKFTAALDIAAALACALVLPAGALAALGCALVLPAGALAAQPVASAGQSVASAGQSVTIAAQSVANAGQSMASARQPVAIAAKLEPRGPVRTIAGTVTAAGSSLTIQTGGRLMGRINAMTATANAITAKDYPYVYAGGHSEAGVASIGMTGPGYTGHTLGYDCSGSVAAVLAGAGLWPAGSGVPDDAGVVAQLLQEHYLARGAGRGLDEVTLYDHPGVHIFMNIDGRFFGTSDGGGGGNRKGGAGWLDDGARDVSSRAYKQYHVLASVLHDRISYGHSYTFLVMDPSVIAGAQVGSKVRVAYQPTGAGTIVLRSLAFVGAVTTSGTVTSIALDGGSFVIQTPAGDAETFFTGGDVNLVDGLQPGAAVQVLYTNLAGLPTAHVVTITAPPVPAPSGTGGSLGSARP